MGEKIEAKVTHPFRASAERVYDAWLDPERVRLWLAAALKACGLAGDIRRVEIDPRVGGKFFFSDLREGKEARHWGTYLALQRPGKIVFTWITDESEESNPSQVTVSIVPQAQGCTATIVHEMDAEWKEYVERVESGWLRMLRAIDAVEH